MAMRVLGNDVKDTEKQMVLYKCESKGGKCVIFRKVGVSQVLEGGHVGARGGGSELTLTY